MSYFNMNIDILYMFLQINGCLNQTRIVLVCVSKFSWMCLGRFLGILKGFVICEWSKQSSDFGRTVWICFKNTGKTDGKRQFSIKKNCLERYLHGFPKIIICH